MLYQIEKLKALKQCFKLDVILKEPEADYFWYSHSDKLTWATPEQEEVHSQSIQFDKDKIKSFLRDIKLNTILNEN